MLNKKKHIKDTCKRCFKILIVTKSHPEGYCNCHNKYLRVIRKCNKRLSTLPGGKRNSYKLTPGTNQLQIVQIP